MGSRLGFLVLMRPLLLTLLTALTLAAHAAPKPNIVIILADDLGYGDVQSYNPTRGKIPTPHIDRLAREGMRFTDGHASSAACSPSRYTLLTGRYHWRTKLQSGIVDMWDPPLIAPDRLTIAGLAKQHGYRTAAFGKWHLGWDWDAIKRPGAKADPKTGFAPAAFDWSKPIPGGPRDRGFDYYFGDDVPNFPPYAWFENDRVVTTPSVPLTITPPTAEGNWEARPGPMTPGWDFHAVMPKLTERAVGWIGEQRGQSKPFFLYVPFTSPHAPIVPGNPARAASAISCYRRTPRWAGFCGRWRRTVSRKTRW